jgi:hypothetical protein
VHLRNYRSTWLVPIKPFWPYTGQDRAFATFLESQNNTRQLIIYQPRGQRVTRYFFVEQNILSVQNVTFGIKKIGHAYDWLLCCCVQLISWARLASKLVIKRLRLKNRRMYLAFLLIPKKLQSLLLVVINRSVLLL